MTIPAAAGRPAPAGASSRRLCLAWALPAALAVLAWQAATVYCNYAGNWTGLFRTGRAMPVPERIAPHTFRNAHPGGYDGQFYHFLAHDPFLLDGTAAYLDAPLLRSRRILIPLAAWLLAAGQQQFVDAAFLLLIAASIFAGVYWLARIMADRGRRPAYGLLFLLVPATVVAIDSMTVDVSLAALAAAFVYYSGLRRDRVVWLTVAAAGLVRETGLLLVLACVLPVLIRRDFRKAAFWASAAVPALAWFAYLHIAIPPAAGGEAVPAWVFDYLQFGIVLRLLDPVSYPNLSPQVEIVVRVLDRLALLATMAVTVIGALRWARSRTSALAMALILHVALVLAMTNKYFWNSTYGYSRPITPLFVFLISGAGGQAAGWWWAASIAAAFVVDLRIFAECMTQVLGVLRWCWGG